MTDYKNEYQKFADKAVTDRAREEGFGRLRLGIFWAAVGGLAIFVLNLLGQMPPPRWLAMLIVGTAPLSVVLLIVNYIRLPNDHKASPQAILIGLVTLVGAGGTIALATYYQLFKTISN